MTAPQRDGFKYFGHVQRLTECHNRLMRAIRGPIENRVVEDVRPPDVRPRPVKMRIVEPLERIVEGLRENVGRRASDTLIVVP